MGLLHSYVVHQRDGIAISCVVMDTTYLLWKWVQKKKKKTLFHYIVLGVTNKYSLSLNVFTTDM